ncbi:hypothetical protein [Pseudomonas citronellolis]|uniref:hypothetical protein n=1 Tax=Pseudomonas citronellolis TaxID=53408 RepID=UPI002FD8FDB5
MSEDGKLLIGLFVFMIAVFVVGAAAIVGETRAKTECAIQSARAGWTAEEAKEACR